MTNQAAIQSKIWRGYAKAAEKLGVSYQFYRPAPGNFPGAALFTRYVSLNAEDMKYGRPNKYGKATSYAVTDATGLQAGDYFTGPEGTFFLASLQPLVPILAVQCNHTVSLSRVQPPSGVGSQGYGGLLPDNVQAYVTGVPCSILHGTKGEKNDANLPADTRQPWWVILMPAAVGTVQYGDLITDEGGRRYVVSAAELTDLGWRLTAALATV